MKPAAEQTASMPSGASLDFAGVCRLLNLNPDTTTVATLNRLAKEKTDAKPKFTTIERISKYEDLLTEGRSYIRKGDKEKRLHRVVHLFPRFTGMTGEEVIPHPDTKEECVYAIYICVVEMFEEKTVQRTKEGGVQVKEKARIVLGGFNMEADRFLQEFEQA